MSDEEVKPAGDAIPTMAELRRMAEMLATPIDFETLVAQGVLRKRGAWWEVLNWDGLPEHASFKINNLMTGNRVQFSKHNPKLLDQLE